MAGAAARIGHSGLQVGMPQPYSCVLGEGSFVRLSSLHVYSTHRDTPAASKTREWPFRSNAPSGPCRDANWKVTLP